MSKKLNIWVALAATLIALAIPVHCVAQSRVSNSRTGAVQRNTQALGVVGSVALGSNGIAYRRYVGNNFFQLSFFPLFTQDSDGTNRNWSVRGGLSLGRYLVIIERPRVNSWFAPTIALRSLVNVSGSIGEETHSQTTADGPVAEITAPSRRLWLGAGMGVE
ncbi:MAG: hypothetical protein CMH53_10725, partial [Myxococcales bacterium]|nr:hypothetical protein [Myxococcales bacterium]